MISKPLMSLKLTIRLHFNQCLRWFHMQGGREAQGRIGLRWP